MTRPAATQRPHATASKLPFPVIVPQRRPGTKTRGFVRAYAPVLADSSVDQPTFLKFLSDLHKHAQASPIFDVVMVSAGLMGLYPDPMVFKPERFLNNGTFDCSKNDPSRYVFGFGRR